jgi:hypothetical protein
MLHLHYTGSKMTREPIKTDREIIQFILSKEYDPHSQSQRHMRTESYGKLDDGGSLAPTEPIQRVRAFVCTTFYSCPDPLLCLTDTNQCD